MNEFLNAVLYESWPWYVGGPLIGLLGVVVLITERKAIGVSSSFEQVCAFALPAGASRGTILKDTWQLWFVAGMVLGGAALYAGSMTTSSIAISANTVLYLNELGVSDTSGYVPSQLYSFALPQLTVLLLGGFLIGFGARYAGGCTAGHSIVGIASLSTGSLLSTVGFFAGGLLSTWFLVPIVLAL